jgi:hypothetical protein
VVQVACGALVGVLFACAWFRATAWAADHVFSKVARSPLGQAFGLRDTFHLGPGIAYVEYSQVKHWHISRWFFNCLSVSVGVCIGGETGLSVYGGVTSAVGHVCVCVCVCVCARARACACAPISVRMHVCACMHVCGPL